VAENSRKPNFQLVLAIAAGASTAEAAERAGMAERTARRHLARPDVRAEVAQARERLLDAAVGALADSAVEAVKVLRELMRDRESPPQVRAGAARTLLESAVRRREFAGYSWHEMDRFTREVLNVTFGVMETNEEKLRLATALRQHFTAG
jgi:hypothetical protein